MLSKRMSQKGINMMSRSAQIAVTADFLLQAHITPKLRFGDSRQRRKSPRYRSLVFTGIKPPPVLCMHNTYAYFTFLTDTRHTQGSRTPVPALALILQGKENLFLHRTQLACTGSLWETPQPWVLFKVRRAFVLHGLTLGSRRQMCIYTDADNVLWVEISAQLLFPCRFFYRPFVCVCVCFLITLMRYIWIKRCATISFPATDFQYSENIEFMTIYCRTQNISFFLRVCLSDFLLCYCSHPLSMAPQFHLFYPYYMTRKSTWDTWLLD